MTEKAVVEIEKSRATSDTVQGRGRTVSRVATTSDVTRVRDMAFAAAAGALAAVVAAALVPSRMPESAPGPIARPHAQANVACNACHRDEKDGADAKSACRGCHGVGNTLAHASLRPSHRALAAKGQLGCTSCHPAHGDARGVTFAGDGSYVLWSGNTETRGTLSHGAPAGATVPLIPLTLCARCHDTSDERDPIFACIVRGAPVATCFDEHQNVSSKAVDGNARCAHQHTPARFVAWEAAREVARDVPNPAPPRGSAPWMMLGLALCASASTLGGMSVFRRMQKRRESSGGAKTPLAPASRVRLPHINTSTCIGCYACVDACPFDVLEIERYVAVVARPADCCGVVLCQQVCPNGSLQITEGDPIEERPNLDPHLESKDAPGVFVVGDLSGLPLIKNAIHQGRSVVDRICATLPNKRAKANAIRDVDVVIVGAGPAGLSASLRARERGLSYVTLEQGTIASSVRSFPRGKLVYDQPLNLPALGELWLKETTKEELLLQWTRIVRAQKLEIREHRRVVDVSRDEGKIVVTSLDADGASATVRASRLVLAIGKRGSPRTLDCDIAPGAESRVAYSLADARSFAGQRVVVVGLGDSAMEAAVALARQPDTRVVISYRGPDFRRGRARNVSEMKRLVAKGHLRVVFESTVARIDAMHVVLDVKGQSEAVPYDAALVLIGGTPSWDLVRKAGVKFVAQVVAPTHDS